MRRQPGADNGNEQKQEGNAKAPPHYFLPYNPWAINHDSVRLAAMCQRQARRIARRGQTQGHHRVTAFGRTLGQNPVTN